jgi:hypothetical protein
MTSRLSAVLALAFALAAGSARAEMLEFPAPDGSVKAWPKLPAVEGWHQDQQASFVNTANALIPDGVTFDSADATILAKGLPRSGKSLGQVIEDDRAAASDGSHAVKLADIADKDGRPFIMHGYTPAKSGRWEVDAYAEEGHYLLVFTLSARSQADYDKAFPVFSQLLQDYAEMIPW